MICLPNRWAVHTVIDIALVLSLISGANHAPLPDFHVQMQDIFHGLVSLDPNKGPGPDGLPPTLLIKCAFTLLLPLTILFNHSLCLDTFSGRWKMSFLVPVFKNGARNKLENYRGIAIIWAIPKLFERFGLRGILKGFLRKSSEHSP